MRKSLLAVLVLLALPALADEGMWMPQQVPQLAEELRKQGLQIDPNQLADLTGYPMGAVIQIPGCTASFVSADGLVITNHHCAYGSVQHNSAMLKRDLLREGFLAKTREEELQAAPGTKVWVTTNIEDVTDRITGSLNPKLTDRDRLTEIQRREKALVTECEKPGGVRCGISSFFEGSQYLRLTQMEIRDVRLAYAPAAGIGEFGGETDNWMWPRHTGDWAFYRAYVGKDSKPADYSKDNVPYQPKQWLKVSTEGVDAGDLVFALGYPGRTFRYQTEYEVENARTFRVPTIIRYAQEMNRILNEVGKNNRETQIKNASRIRSNDNLLKNYIGTLSTLERGDIARARREREAALEAWIAKTPSAAKYAGAVAQIRQIGEEQNRAMHRDQVLFWLPRSSPMLSQAEKIVRWSHEQAKKDVDRNPGYQERDRAGVLQASARAQSQIDLASDRAALRFFLLEATKLPADQRIAPLDKMLVATGETTPERQVEKFLDQLYASTKLADADARKAMYDETSKQLEARNDSFLQVAAALLPLRLEIEARDERLTGAMTRVRPLYLQALREMSGGRMYPDANSSLRVTFGTVTGYSPRDAVKYDPQTKVSGILQKDTGEGEFASPKNLLAAIRERRFGSYVDRELGEVGVNFLSTVDTTGGSSGSPTLNAKGELIGLNFDGNYEALGSDYRFDPNITRSIHVDMTYVLWVMDAVDGAHNLLREMRVTPRF